MGNSQNLVALGICPWCGPRHQLILMRHQNFLKLCASWFPVILSFMLSAEGLIWKQALIQLPVNREQLWNTNLTQMPKSSVAPVGQWQYLAALQSTDWNTLQSRTIQHCCAEIANGGRIAVWIELNQGWRGSGYVFCISTLISSVELADQLQKGSSNFVPREAILVKSFSWYSQHGFIGRTSSSNGLMALRGQAYLEGDRCLSFLVPEGQIPCLSVRRKWKRLSSQIHYFPVHKKFW